MKLRNASLPRNDTSDYKTDPVSLSEFYIGLGLAISSCLFIGTSFIFKKLGLNRLAARGIRAGDGGHGYLKDWMWWSGLILMASGEGANFAAYAFAPATLVTPLGALSVLVTAVLSSRFLGESLNLLGKVGCVLCITGSTMIVLHSPKEQEVQSLAELVVKLQDPGFIIYGTLVLVLNVFLIFFCGPRWGGTNPLIYLTVAGTIGSLSVMGCKGIGVAIKETIGGHSQVGNWLTWLMVVCVAGFIAVQMNYLNKALDIFTTSVVTPILYVSFTSFVIIASAILFKEWRKMRAEDYLGVLAGFTTIIVAIFLLNAFKEVPVTLSTLNVRVRRDAGEAAAAGVNKNGGTAWAGAAANRRDETRVKLLEAVDGSDEYDERDGH